MIYNALTHLLGTSLAQYSTHHFHLFIGCHIQSFGFFLIFFLLISVSLPITHLLTQYYFVANNVKTIMEGKGGGIPMYVPHRFLNVFYYKKTKKKNENQFSKDFSSSIEHFVVEFIL